MFGILSCLIGLWSSPTVADSTDYGDQARTISSRIRNGVPFAWDDPRLNQMTVLLQTGNALGAADIATQDRDFLEQTVRQLAAPMLNLNQDPTDNAMNDALALILGSVRDNRYFPEVLYTTAQYVIRGQRFSSTRQNLAAWDPTLSNLTTDLVRIDDGTDPMGYGLPPDDRSGVITTDKWAQQFDSAGTNRRNIKGLMQFSGLIIDDVRAENPNLVYIARDVTRVPDPFQPMRFFTYCAQCHGTIDAMRDAFFHVDYGAVAGGGMGIVPVPGGAAKYAINTDKFPGGHVTTDTSWQMRMDPGLQSSLGWPQTDLSGGGIHSLGVAWSKFRSFHQGMVNRVAALVCPGVTLDASSLNALTSSFEKDGNLRTLFKRVVTLPRCLGT
jgi:hypothetical protein